MNFNINAGSCCNSCKGGNSGNKTNQSNQNPKKTDPKKNIIPNTDTEKGTKTPVINKLPNKSTTDKSTPVVHETSTTTNINATAAAKMTTGATAKATAPDTIESLKQGILEKYTELKILLQYFFKKKIVKILDIDIENITNKNFKDSTTLQKIKTELENKIKPNKNKPLEDPIANYAQLAKNDLYGVLYACCQSTFLVNKNKLPDRFGNGILNFINYITCGHDGDSKFLNIFKWSSKKSDFYYNFTKALSDAGNCSFLRKRWAQNISEYDFTDVVNGTYSIYCNATGENLNNSNDIKTYFEINFSDEDILNNFENDDDRSTVIEFIKNRI